MTIDKEELTKLLEKFKGDVQTAIDEKTKDIDSSQENVTKEVDDLKSKLEEVNKAIEELKELQKKPFGLPGVEFEKDRWSWGKYFVGMAKDFKAHKGLISSSEAQRFWDKEGSFEYSVCKDYNATDGSEGGFIVPPQIYQGDVIDVVYANTAIMKMPVMKFTGLKNDLPIPYDDGHLTAYSLGETTAPTKSAANFGLKWLRPKKIGVYVRVSNRLLDQTNGAIEMIVKNKMAMDAAVELSRCLTNGKGSDSEGKGILQFYDQFTGKSNLAVNGRRLTIDDLADMLMSLDDADELKDTNTYGTIMHPSALWGMIRETVEMYSGQPSRNGAKKTQQLLIAKSEIEAALGMKIEKTTQIPKATLGTSSTNTKVVTGDWSKFAYATFRDPIFRVSDVASDSTGRSALLNDELFMVMFLEYDCNCLRPTAFTGRDGAETNKANW